MLFIIIAKAGAVCSLTHIFKSLGARQSKEEK